MRIASQVVFVVITNQNEVFTDLKKNFVDQNQTMFMKLPNQSIFLNFSNMTKI